MSMAIYAAEMWRW